MRIVAEVSSRGVRLLVRVGAHKMLHICICGVGALVGVLARGVDGEAARDGVERREEERAWLGLGLGLGLGSGLGLGLG